MLAALLTVEFFIPPLRAQQPAPPGPKLNIVIVEGEGAVDNIRQRVSREPIVQVEDENHKPVAGAAVVFLLPNQGASGVFANGSHTLTVITDAQGRAVASGIRTNGAAGKMQIHVTASFQGQTATAVINRTSVAVAGAAISAKLLIILLLAGAGVAGGVVAATRGGGGGNGNNTSPGSPTVITPGTPTVGGPQ
ncbi:MAG: hypothetical protein ACRD9L_03240 [Bryobacteraceae bacterium]